MGTLRFLTPPISNFDVFQGDQAFRGVTPQKTPIIHTLVISIAMEKSVFVFFTFNHPFLF